MFEVLGTFGIINDSLAKIGIERVSFLSDPKYFRSIYIGSGIWQGVGWGSILYLATISGINPELYLAASIDGAGRIGKIRHITLPGLVPTIRILLIFDISGMISIGFEKAYLMQNPSIYETADIISTYVYRMGIQQMNMSYGTAIGLFEGIVSVVLLITANNFIKKISGEGGLW
jgi:putative aldouronate transport system permease protein